MLINSLPLYWRLKKNQFSEALVPTALPFDVDEIEGLSLLTQKHNQLTLKTLKKIYGFNDNVGYLQENNSIAKPYYNDFKSYLDNVISNNEIGSILEVGTGGCSLISAFHKSGFTVLGIDSSPLSAEIGKKLGFPVITDFYPSSQLTSKHNLIYSVDVLEHIEEPVKFLEGFKENLLPNGSVVLNVPDCTESIKKGDISMFIHQHLNYFDLYSLVNVVSAAGFEVKDCRKSNYGGSIYLHATLKSAEDVNYKNQFIKKNIVEEFLNKANSNILNMKKILQNFITRSEATGFYIPLRAFPYLSALEDQSNYRIFDDTPEWHGKYFDGYQMPIENMDDFLANPTDNLIIMSLSFGEIIKNKLRSKNNLIKTNIITLDEILIY